MPSTLDLVRRASGLMKLGRPKPVWYDTVANRCPPLTFQAPASAKASRPRPKNAHQPIWRPPKLVYPEDKYVQKLFKRWPLEKLRPTSINETMEDPKDVQSVINKQLELMEEGLGTEKAFQVASSEFMAERRREEIEERLARQQSLHMKEQVAATAGEKPFTSQQKRVQSIGEVIRSVLEEEKAVLGQQ